MNVGAACDSGDGVAEGDEGHSQAPQFVQQHAAIGTVGVQRNIYSIPMIESQMIVKAGLAKCAYRQSVAELRNDEALYVTIN